MILRNNIFKTTIFYGQMRRRLSIAALARMLGVAIPAIEEEVRQLIAAGLVEMVDGEVGIVGGEYRFSVVAREKAFKRLKFAVWLAGCNPFVVGIFGANSLALDSVKATSDVDVVVVVQRGRVYMARFLFALPLFLLKLRPHQTEQFPLCASFFIDETRSLADIPLAKDIYFAHWASSLVGYGNVESMKSLQSYMAGYSLTLPVSLGEIPVSFFQAAVRRVLKLLFDYDWAERLFMKFQLWYMPATLKTGGSGIMIGPDIFKAHVDDKRAMLQENFEKLCSEKGV